MIQENGLRGSLINQNGNDKIQRGDRMNYHCTTCNMEKGMYIRLSEENEGGERVCSMNPNHRFKVDNFGFLESVKR
jgi:hypothetical protein